jgi:fluoride ion exporter CrcB/FEX
MSYAYCKTECNYRRLTLNGGLWPFFGGLKHFSGILRYVPHHRRIRNKSLIAARFTSLYITSSFLSITVLWENLHFLYIIIITQTQKIREFMKVHIQNGTGFLSTYFTISYFISEVAKSGSKTQHKWVIYNPRYMIELCFLRRDQTGYVFFTSLLVYSSIFSETRENLSRFLGTIPT